MVDSSSVDRVINRLIADESNFPAAVMPRVAAYLYQVVRELKPEMVIETGCHVGVSTLHMGKALMENGFGKCASFDLDISRAEDNVREAGLGDYVELVEGDSSVMVDAYLGRHHGKFLDLVFIDGDHTRRGCTRDFDALHGSVRKGGYIILHDIYPERCGWKGPRLVLDMLSELRSFTDYEQYDIDELENLDPYGIAVCRKLSSGKNPVGDHPGSNHFMFRLKTSWPVTVIELLQFYRRIYRNPVDFLFQSSVLLYGLIRNKVVKFMRVV